MEVAATAVTSSTPAAASASAAAASDAARSPSSSASNFSLARRMRDSCLLSCSSRFSPASAAPSAPPLPVNPNRAVRPEERARLIDSACDATSSRAANSASLSSRISRVDAARWSRDRRRLSASARSLTTLDRNLMISGWRPAASASASSCPLERISLSSSPTLSDTLRFHAAPASACSSSTSAFPPASLVASPPFPTTHITTSSSSTSATTSMAIVASVTPTEGREYTAAHSAIRLATATAAYEIAPASITGVVRDVSVAAKSAAATAPVAKSFPAVARADIASRPRRALRRTSSVRATFSAAAISAAVSAASRRCFMRTRRYRAACRTVIPSGATPPSSSPLGGQRSCIRSWFSCRSSAASFNSRALASLSASASARSAAASRPAASRAAATPCAKDGLAWVIPGGAVARGPADAAAGDADAAAAKNAAVAVASSLVARSRSTSARRRISSAVCCSWVSTDAAAAAAAKKLIVPSAASAATDTRCRRMSSLSLRSASFMSFRLCTEPRSSSTTVPSAVSSSSRPSYNPRVTTAAAASALCAVMLAAAATAADRAMTASRSATPSFMVSSSAFWASTEASLASRRFSATMSAGGWCLAATERATSSVSSAEAAEATTSQNASSACVFPPPR
mmetsp:Transcript_27827/g.69823  ORF Transcript_27827/g.69823 Transcript_27827/m.69823 type:complete len:632 (-) Transcript_27827:3354-5249(-)